MEARTCPPPSPLHDSNHFHAQAPYLWEQSISAPSSYNREVVQPKMAKKVHLGSAKSTCSIFSVHILWPSFIVAAFAINDGNRLLMMVVAMLNIHHESTHFCSHYAQPSLCSCVQDPAHLSQIHFGPAIMN